MAEAVAQHTEGVPPQPGTPEHDALMREVAERHGLTEPGESAQSQPAQNQPAPAAQRPEYIPEKFWDAEKGQPNLEAWAQSTRELEAELTRLKQERAQQQQSDGEPQQGDQQAAPQPLPVEQWEQAYNETGELPAEAIEQLEKLGLPRQYLETYFAGLEALQRTQEQTLLQEAGIPDRATFDKMAEWAAANLDAEEVARFNAVMDSGSTEAMALALKTLKSQYEAGVGAGANELLQGTPAAQGSTAGFRSSAELRAAMSDPRYKTDPAYRAEVERRLAQTPDNIF